MQILDYDPNWPIQFEQFHSLLWPAVHDLATSIEHVGSTSVPGLAAKPVIDLDIIIPAREVLPQITSRLNSLGYIHRGNLGIEDRESYSIPELKRTHRLYVCPASSLALKNHLTLRDHLRANPQDRDAYATIKQQLAIQFPNDIDSYIAGKTEFILGILAICGFPQSQLDDIRRANGLVTFAELKP